MTKLFHEQLPAGSKSFDTTQSDPSCPVAIILAKLWIMCVCALLSKVSSGVVITWYVLPRHAGVFPSMMTISCTSSSLAWRNAKHVVSHSRILIPPSSLPWSQLKTELGGASSSGVKWLFTGATTSLHPKVVVNSSSQLTHGWRRFSLILFSGVLRQCEARNLIAHGSDQAHHPSP